MQAKAKKIFGITLVIYLISFSIVSIFSIPYWGEFLTIFLVPVIFLIPVMISSFFTMRVPLEEPKLQTQTGFVIKRTTNNSLQMLDVLIQDESVKMVNDAKLSGNNTSKNATASDVKEEKRSNTKLVMEATNEILGAVNEGLESFNHEMSMFNAAMKLKRERTETLKKKKSDFKVKIALLEKNIETMRFYDDLKSKNMFGIIEKKT